MSKKNELKIEFRALSPKSIDDGFTLQDFKDFARKFNVPLENVTLLGETHQTYYDEVIVDVLFHGWRKATAEEVEKHKVKR